MNLSEFASTLSTHTDLLARFILPSGWEVPEHFGFMEICYVSRMRIEDASSFGVEQACCSFHLAAGEPDEVHTITCADLLQMLKHAPVLPVRDLRVRVSCPDLTSANLYVVGMALSGAYIDFVLAEERASADLLDQDRRGGVCSCC